MWRDNHVKAIYVKPTSKSDHIGASVDADSFTSSFYTYSTMSSVNLSFHLDNHKVVLQNNDKEVEKDLKCSILLL